MIFPIKTKNDVPKGNKAFVDAVHKLIKNGVEPIASDHQLLSSNNDSNSEMNASSIQSAIIKLTGRFAEAYASDVILTLADLQPFLSRECPTEEGEWVIVAGIRQYGVDHDSFVCSRLRDVARFRKIKDPVIVMPAMTYSKLLAIHVVERRYPHDPSLWERHIRLFDITDKPIRIELHDND